MTKHLLPLLFLSATGLVAQNTAIFPADYTNVAEGPLNSPNLPLANGTGRAQIVYEAFDLTIPAGASITKVGFREDHGVTAMDAGRALQLEIRMGYTANHSGNLSTTLDSNWTSAPVTVFGPALFQLPNLREAANPLASGRFDIPLATPFVYQPALGNLLVEYRIFGNSGGGGSFSYRLDRADFYSPVVNGVPGCPHSGNRTPVMTLSPVRCGGQFSAAVTNAPATTFAALVLDLGTPMVAPYALDAFVPGIAAACQGQVSLIGAQTMSAVTNTSGGVTFAFTIPNVRMPYNDMFVSAQSAFFDLFSPAGVVVSNPAQLQIGIQPQSTVVWGSGPPSSVTTGSTSLRYCPVAFFTWQ